MKNFFRKLHIGEGSGDDGAAPPPSHRGSGRGGGTVRHPLPEQRQPPTASASASSVEVEGGGERAQSGAGHRRRAEEEEEMERRQSQLEERIASWESLEEEARRREKEEDLELEEFKLQLVLEMSRRDNPEEPEFGIGKRTSLGSSPEVLAARYWCQKSLDVDCPQVKSCIEIAQKCVGPTIGEIIHKLDETESMVEEVVYPAIQ